MKKNIYLFIKINTNTFAGSVVCPRCETLCSDCSAGDVINSNNNASEAIEPTVYYSEELDQDGCSNGLNSLADFLSGFGLDLGRR